MKHFTRMISIGFAQQAPRNVYRGMAPVTIGENAIDAPHA
jgi:hypothetical protein